MKAQQLAFAVVIAGFASASYLAGQIRTQVDLVVVPASVRDDEGRLVTGLTPADFRVFEDGKLQTISNFSIDPQPLSAAILIDDGLSRTVLQRLFPPVSPPLIITLTSGFSAFDEMMSFRYDHVVHKLSDFTNNPFVIEESYKDIPQIAETRPEDPADVLGEKGPRWLRSIINVLGSGTGGKPATTPGAPPPSPRANPRPSNRVMHEAIYEAAVALQSRAPDRRKMIYVISDGRDIGSNGRTLADNTKLLLQNEIQVYGVATDFATFGSFGLLTEYARATGGDVYPGTSTKSMEDAFAQIAEQARNQYVLGYVSNNAAGPIETSRTIEVRTTSPRHKVAHRQGYLQQPKR